MAKGFVIISGVAAALIMTSQLTFAQAKKADPASADPVRSARLPMENMSLPTRQQLAKR